MGIAWITGAKGFIGRHTALQLAGEGATVAGLGHGALTTDEAAKWGLRCWINGEVIQANLDNLANQAGLPDRVFHLAGGASVGASLQAPEEDFQRSVGSTAHLLEWVRRHAPTARVVLGSSAGVYGAGYTRPIAESDKSRPHSPYGYHKLMAEMLSEYYSIYFGLRTATVRLFSIYGPGLRKQLLWDLCCRARDNAREIALSGTGRELRDWLHVSDAASCLVAASMHVTPKGFVVNGGTGREVSVREIAEAICEAWGSEARIEFSGVSRPGDPQYLVADTTTGHSIGFQPKIDWRAGIAEYVTWFRDQN
jgi:UDP-glucose 4-epimerase